ncbi:MAG: indolepyruvate ferredoxin oxidoreductase subunit alpha [Archaeoglobaceae archaeon]
MVKKVILDAQGKKVFLLGNEAIARGAIEAGVDVVATYPGTPSSEIADTLALACSPLRGRMDYYMEYSTNEKVAFEVAVGASLAGKRGMAIMKHVGVNVAADALISFAQVGARGGLVLVSADDPGMHSSQNEQDNRWFGKLAMVPVIEPSSTQEAKEFTELSFKISEKFGLPVILRTVTRLSHSRGVVTLGELPQKALEKVKWESNIKTDVLLPAHARVQKIALQEKLSKVQEFLSKSAINWIEPGSDTGVGVIASGLSYTYVKEAMENLGLDLPVLKLSSTYPIPEKLIEEFLDELKGVIIVEELDPFIEWHVRAMTDVEVYGKNNGYFPLNFEYNTGIVEQGIARVLDMETSVDYAKIEERAKGIAQKAPPRPPVLCPGCPHTATYYAIKKVAKEKGNAALPSDIGCYTLAASKPLEAVETCICMGASVGVSNGLSYVVDDPVVATVGDSTFIHTGVPALIDAVYNQANFVLVVLDNRTTGMTGHQPHPGTGTRPCGLEGREVSIEGIARGAGVDFVEVVNPYDIRKTKDVLKRALDHQGVSVVVSRMPCSLLWVREKRKAGEKIPVYTVTDDCNMCMECITSFTCPAIFIREGKVAIDENMCVGCGVCSRICPEKAIKICNQDICWVRGGICNQICPEKSIKFR